MLSDALDREKYHLKEARSLVGQARPSRPERRQGVQPPNLAGGVTFALDLSPAFDTVSRQEIIDLLTEQGAAPETVRLVQALHDRSKHHLQAVETPAGIKQRSQAKATPGT